MKFRGEWGTVCSESVRTEDEFVLLCKLLGYTGIDPADAANITTLDFGPGNLSRRWIYSADCYEQSQRMSLCSRFTAYSANSCKFWNNDAGISCNGETLPMFV